MFHTRDVGLRLQIYNQRLYGRRRLPPAPCPPLHPSRIKYTLRAAENWRYIPSISYTLSISVQVRRKIAFFAIFRIAKRTADFRFAALSVT
jgi:hypothetical protein